MKCKKMTLSQLVANSVGSELASSWLKAYTVGYELAVIYFSWQDTRLSDKYILLGK
jgi:hypothetical protein